MGDGWAGERVVKVWNQGSTCPRSRGILTCEGGSGGWTEVLGNQQLVVLLTCQGAIHNLVLLDLCFAVVPLEVNAGCRVRAHPQVLGGINL